jgi:adenylate cyclase
MPRGSGSPSAAEGLPAVATLAGNKVPVAVMNASLDGLTTLIGNLQAQQAAALIEDYHREVEAIVARHRGMVAAFDGEAWTCVFGLLPRPQPPHVAALLAVHAGLSVVDWVVEAKIRFARSGGSAALGENVVDMVAGIGIASGTGVIGVVGAKDRLTATVLADTVGKAQRLRSLTRELGGGLLIDGTTYGHLAKDQDQFEYGRYGRAPLSADGEEETMFEVVGRKNRLVEDDAERIT